MARAPLDILSEMWYIYLPTQEQFVSKLIGFMVETLSLLFTTLQMASRPVFLSSIRRS